MDIWISILVAFLSIIAPLVIMGFGRLLKSTTFERNSWFGVRTRAIMKSQAVWDYAHALFGKLIEKINAVISIVGLISLSILLSLVDTEQATLIVVGVIVPSVLSVISIIICGIYADRKAVAFNKEADLKSNNTNLLDKKQ